MVTLSGASASSAQSVTTDRLLTRLKITARVDRRHCLTLQHQFSTGARAGRVVRASVTAGAAASWPAPTERAR